MKRVVAVAVGVLLMAVTMFSWHNARAAADDLSSLSDEFDNAATIAQWKQLNQEEKWPADQLERYDINKTAAGSMVMMPYTSVWYRDYKGVLVFKPVTGDFVMTTRVYVTGRNGKDAPRSGFSLAGIMIRAPRNVTPQTREPNGENYIFLSLGSATSPGNYQFEAKTTINSESQLTITEANSAEALIQVTRVGPHIILLAKTPNRPWTVIQRYHRPDLPETLQAGFTSYTDYPTCKDIPVHQHNTQVIRAGNPDIIAWFDYARYARPQAELQDQPLSNRQIVSDTELLQWLGDAANPAP
jgi:hypothetical protein